jgi:hypothetical protein
MIHNTLIATILPDKPYSVREPVKHFDRILERIVRAGFTIHQKQPGIVH